MKKCTFDNKYNEQVHYLSWQVEDEKCSVVISHGMAEHAARYDEFARFLNSFSISVYAIEHIGHGVYAKNLGHIGKDDFDKCASNINELINLVKENSNKKVILFGHSMGSFISQLYITKYNNIDALILCGSNKSNFVMRSVKLLTSMVCLFSKDTTKASNFLNNIAFSSYNKQFKPNKTDYDWLNRDENEVKKYINDPYCGFICSQQFFDSLSQLFIDINKKKNLNNINRELPILIIGGSKDPVSNNGVGLNKLYNQYKKLNVKDVTLKIYEGARHEILLEINKNEVFNDCIDFINKNM